MKTRRDFLISIGSGAVALALTPSVMAKTQSHKRPNIIFIMSDDHASHAISAYGSTINKTPNIDRLATEGMRFDNCFCTNSICSPSRAVILTGKYSHLNGVLDNRVKFDGSQQTLPKLLQQSGYQTAIVGKWHLKSIANGSRPRDWRTAVYYRFYEKGFGIGPHEGIRTKRYKLIHFLYGDMGWELYDLNRDPNELNNIYASAQNEGFVEDLKERLASLKRRYKVTR